MTTPPLPEHIELHRDRMWRRDEDLRIESAVDAERFIEDVGFANTLTDTRRAGPSLYIAVCGRRDATKAGVRPAPQFFNYIIWGSCPNVPRCFRTPL